jgi:hypothetical protein
MKNSLLLAIALVFIIVVHAAQGMTIIDYPPVGSCSSGADLAEWITVPASDTRLDYFQFYGVSAQFSDVNFNAKIYIFDPITFKTVGLLYDSGPQIATLNTEKTFVFDVGGMNLVPGGHYLFDLNQMDHGNTGVLNVRITNLPYDEGGGINRDDIWPDKWKEIFPGSMDLAFRAGFNIVPEPSTFAMLLAVALGGLLWSRRRT